jgi:hypothetical protein
MREPSIRTAATAVLACTVVSGALASARVHLQDGLQHDNRFTVFVTIPANEGFADVTEAVLASQAFVRLALARMQEIRFAERAEDADAVVVLVARGEGSHELSASFKRYQAPLLAGTPITMHREEKFVHAVLVVGPTGCEGGITLNPMAAECYRRSLVGMGFSHGADRWDRNAKPNSWEACAEAIALDVRAWLITNSGKLRSSRAGR